jgi:hypothetical protein
MGLTLTVVIVYLNMPILSIRLVPANDLNGISSSLIFSNTALVPINPFFDHDVFNHEVVKWSSSSK